MTPQLHPLPARLRLVDGGDFQGHIFTFDEAAAAAWNAMPENADWQIKPLHRINCSTDDLH
jgi:hypothetical protein